MEKNDCDYFEIDSQYYTTSDVRLNTTKYVLKEKYDALLSDVRVMVEAAKNYINEGNDKRPVSISLFHDQLKELKQSIATVEARLKEADGGKDNF